MKPYSVFVFAALTFTSVNTLTDLLHLLTVKNVIRSLDLLEPLKIIDVITGSEVTIPQTEVVQTFAISPDEKRIAVVPVDGIINDDRIEVLALP